MLYGDSHNELRARITLQIPGPFTLCSNHGFTDGNKRTAAGAALVFLDVNGHELALTIGELEQITIDVATRSLEKERLSLLFEAAIRPVSV